MQRALIAMAAAVLLVAGSTGCAVTDSCSTCPSRFDFASIFGKPCQNSQGGGAVARRASGGRSIAGGCNSCGGARTLAGACSSCGGRMVNGACSGCGAGGLASGHGFGHGHAHNPYGGFTGPAGPPTAAYGYPYYTIRGPRDFLVDNPPTIGR